MNETAADISIIIGLCLAWPMWVWLLCKVFDQPKEADSIASFIGLAILIMGVVMR